MGCYTSLPFKRTFEPSLSFQARLWALASFLSSAPLSSYFLFKRAFQPSLPFEHALASFQAPLWAIAFFSSAPLSPRLLFELAWEPSLSLRARLRALVSFRARLRALASFWVHHRALTSFWVHLRALIFLFLFYLGRSPITMRPFLFLLG
jgi:hypothetical protein